MGNRPSVMAMVAAVMAALGVAACSSITGASRTSAFRTSAPGASVSPPRVRPEEPTCRTSQLTITLTRRGVAVMGEVGGYLRFANSGPATCQIGGWPAVTAVTAAGKTITAVRARHGTMLGAGGTSRRCRCCG
jgi:hypothetical protein